jgi:hypothetical protein
MPEAGFPSLTAEAACAALRAAGLELSPADVRVERREERWAVTLPGDRIAWFAASETGRGRLAVEGNVLRLLAARCSFQAPRILYQSRAGFDVRAIVPGRCDPWPFYEQVKRDSALARRIGRAVGAILVEQHTRVARADVEGWLPEQPNWPEPGIRERVVEIVADQDLAAAIGKALDTYEGLRIDPTDRALIHADLGLHNLAVDPDTSEVRGVFDYDGAAWADRHHDFRYLVMSLPGEPILEAALAIYEPAVGRVLDRRRIWLYNAVCAASFLASRRGVPADEKWCGRTLEDDLRWVRDALGRAASS